MAREHLLDVSELEPPEPLLKVLAELGTLAPGEYLRMLHRMEPFPLYPILSERGVEHDTRAASRSAYEVLIWHRGDTVAERAARTVWQSGALPGTIMPLRNTHRTCALLHSDPRS
jgi:uncharacterized protein (DUF2249 family)